MAPPKHITILGAGLTGLTTAYNLSRLLPQTEVCVLEASNRIGGWMNSKKVDLDFVDSDGKRRKGQAVVESGVRSIRPRGSRGAVSMLKMVRDLDLLDDLIPIPTTHPAAKNRYLLDPTTSKLTILPSSPLSILRPQPPLLKGLLPSILSEPFRSRPKSLTSSSDESIDSFIIRRLGPKIAENMISAMVHGIYAASSTQLSVRSTFGVLYDAERIYGSVVGGMILGTKSREEKMEEQREWDELGELGKRREGWSLYGFKGGLGRLGDRLAQVVKESKVEVRLGQRVTSLKPTSDGVEINIESSKAPIQTSRVISTLSQSTLHTLIPSNPLPHLQTNPATTVGVVNLIYPIPPSQIHPEGFGYLIPRSTSSSGSSSNPEGVLGVVFDSTALPGVDDPSLEGCITKLTVMIGGPHWSLYPSSSTSNTPLPIPTPDILLHQALTHLHRVFPTLPQNKIEPIHTSSVIHPNCIPTYLPGHGERLRGLHEAIKGGEWGGKLSVGGNGYGGVGVNDCVAMGVGIGREIAGGEVATGLERWADWE